MKKVIMAGLIAAASFASLNANAISHEYRARLADSGCTQVDEANGTCNTGASAQQRAHDKSECTQIREANGECEASPRHRGGSYGAPNIVNKFRGEAVDTMSEAGWKQVSQDGTKWKKGSKRATLLFTNSDQVKSVVIR